MAFELNNGSVVLVSLMSSQQNNIVMNTLHYQYTTQGAPVQYTDPCLQLAQAMQTVNTGVVDRMRDLQSSSLFHYAVWVQPVYTTRYTKVALEFGSPGRLDAPPLPMNTAMTITKTSAIAKRYGRGSLHVGGLTTLHQANPGSWNQVGLDLGNLLASAITANVATVAPVGVFTPILWNSKVPQRITLVDGALTQTSIRVERRRTLGLGI